MQLKRSHIISPQPNIEKPIEYQPFISLPISVQSKLQDIDMEKDELFIDVSFPDGTIQFLVVFPLRAHVLWTKAVPRLFLYQ